MKACLLLFLLTASALLVAPARAQQGLQFGPTGGLVLATAHFDDTSPVGNSFAEVTRPLRAGFLAGATARWQAAGHWGVQLAGLFAQQGYSWHYEDNSHYERLDRVRLNYLRLPLLATYSQHAGGQGWQLLAGPYLGVLLGGSRTYDADYLTNGTHQSARVIVGDTYTRPAIVSYNYTNFLPDYTFYSRRFDVGLQGGVGYRWGNTLVQVGYTLGLRNLAATTVYDWGTFSSRSVGAPYRTRGLEASLTYLLGGH